MLEFDNGGRLVQDVSELPPVPSCISRLYLDLETTSRDDKKDSLNPWYHCWVAGICITWDDMPGAYYVPVGHRDPRWNLPRDKVIQWLRDVLASSKTWVNHHVKYDSHALYNDLRLDFDGERVCTIVRSKILDSDRQYRGGYGLDALSLGLLKEDISGPEDEMKPFLGKSKDYGVIPADRMAKYGCQDVITNRRLDCYLMVNLPADGHQVVATETKLTSVLVGMERRGMLVRPADILAEQLYVLTTMVRLEQQLHEAVGYPFLPTSTQDCYDVLVNHYGLPVLSWTEDDEGNPKNPSFDYDALKAYEHRVDAPKEVIQKMIQYRSLSTFKGLFLDSFDELALPTGDGVHAVLHPTHNQCVRTGRMSVSKPNTQQQDKGSKRLFVPGPGRSFLSADASQIEFRTIAHYTQDPAVIGAYLADPDVDYHIRVAEMCGITRRPAKTVNFSVAFGQGRKSTVELLATDEDVVASIMRAVDEMIANGDLLAVGKEAAFKTLARQRGEALYDKYHETFPNIRAVSKRAENVARERGYVRNIMGRRRYLPIEHARKAFNTLNQSSAADIIKARMIALDEMYRGTDLSLVTQVHDEILSVGPSEVLEDPRTQRDVVACLEDVHCLDVPVRFRYGVSSESWMMAACEPKDGGVGNRAVPLDMIKEATQLSHLRG